MHFKVVNLPSHQKMYDRFHFAQGTLTGSDLFCSGQIGTNPDGKSVPSTAIEEFRNLWVRIGDILQAADLGYENIIEYTSYHVGLNEHLSDFIKARDEFLTEPWPAWTAIGVSELVLPDARVELRVNAKR